ncbi:PREDICTED: zinc finger protein 660-like [Rhagoletis zephyria]|uniref:zinc finger protein 660-like n=1 Tax=Rhagoletis zephyria TaxID=28612 RepID=UPI0008117FA7|nr:PREDICTED: zinc finger protein 660-like [Rhagoletis zephyria]
MCTMDATIKEWQRWCRLCAKHDGNYLDIFTEETPLALDSNINIPLAVEEYFHINVKPKDEQPLLLCTECYATLSSLEKYAEHVRKVQKMYHDLINTSDTGEIAFKELYHKYGLFEWKPFKPLLIHDMETSTTTPDIEQVFIADASVTDGGDEDMEEEEAKDLVQATEIKVELSDTVNRGNQSVGECAQMNEGSDSSSSSGSFSSDTEDFEEQVISKKVRKNSKNSNSLDGEESKEGTYSCNICQQRFIQSRNFARHMRRKHGTEAPAVWRCPHCSESLKFKKELERHIKRMHAPKIYPCPHCDRTFKGAKVAENHIKAEHEGVGSFICEECGESMRTKHKIIEHMATHTGQGAYECKECGKHFKRKQTLKRHLEIHGDKHICGECGIELSTSKALLNHMKVHSDEMPYKCNYCGRRFKRTKNLKNHLITHTGLKPYSCDFCDKTFSTGSSCRYHKKHLHPKELAEQEAAGVKAYTKNIPKLHVLKAITQAAGDVEKIEVNVTDKRLRLPKLDAELPDA